MRRRNLRCQLTLRSQVVRAALTLGATLAALLALGGATSVARTPRAYGPHFRYCGAFTYRYHSGTTRGRYHVEVYAQHLRCHNALRVQREYWFGADSRKVVINGGTGAAGYILLKRFPGWRCYSGSGGGGCRHGKAVAAYAD